MVERLGQEGFRLQKLARGAVERPLVAAELPLEFEETMELEYPIALLEPLAFILGRLLEQLCARLEARGLASNKLRLTLELNATDIVEQVSRFSFLVSRKDQVSGEKRETRNEKHYCLRLPVPMLDAGLFLKLLQLLLRAHPPAAPIVKVTLAAEPAKPRPGQGGLFLPVTPAPDRLELTLARLAGIVGEEKIGAAEVLDTHRPDAFQMKRFTLPAPQGLKPITKNAIGAARLKPCPDTNQVAQEQKLQRKSDYREIGASGHLTTDHPMTRSPDPAMALRRFRPPMAATVELRDGEPVRIAAGEIRGDVVSLSGPWRSSGDWWKEKTRRINTDQHGSNWAHEEWDVALSNSNGIALYRIYRDLAGDAWFVEGSYD